MAKKDEKKFEELMKDLEQIVKELETGEADLDNSIEKYTEAMNIGEVAAALEIKCLICDVDCELKEAERYHLNKKALNYDLYDIISDQK